MYRIQGSDNKEYGPIPLETIRQWIGERRLNKDSLACLEGEGVWKPIGQFPEFADLLASATLASAAPGGSPSADPAATRAAAMAKVKVPALMMLVFGIVSVIASIVFGILAINGSNIGQPIADTILNVFKITRPQPSPEQVAMQQTINRFSGIAQIVLGVPWNILIIVGALRMGKLQSRGFAQTAAILSILPCFSICCCISLPVGIWALVVLAKPEVSPQFT